MVQTNGYGGTIMPNASLKYGHARRYRILGACNPSLAHQALERESQLGLLLPCNVVQELDGTTIVSAIDARALLSLVGNSELLQVADEVNGRLRRILERLAALAESG
jgi:uncharacterized protein (DUF302 family)